MRYHQLVSAYILNLYVYCLRVILSLTFPSGNRSVKWRVFGAFSGTVSESCSNDTTFTESTLNSKHLTLSMSDIVIVCDKLDTGYSDPLLGCMYIDRFLRSSAQTVQLLSRLNRRHKGIA